MCALTRAGLCPVWKYWPASGRHPLRRRRESRVACPHRQQSNREKLTELEDVFTGRILPVQPAFDPFAGHKYRLRRLGRTIEDFDLLIGCTALAHNLTLVTRNTRHFVNLSGLRLENWVDG